MNLQVKLLHPDAKKPQKNNPEEDAGFDLFSVEDKILGPAAYPVDVDTGIAVALPEGYYGQIFPRSSLGKKGLQVHLGVIDTGYRGRITVLVYNHSGQTHKILKGDKIAQLVLLPVPPVDVEVVDALPPSLRGAKAFGSSGR